MKNIRTISRGNQGVSLQFVDKLSSSELTYSQDKGFKFNAPVQIEGSVEVVKPLMIDRYFNPLATGSGTGEDWINAYSNIDEAFENLRSNMRLHIAGDANPTKYHKFSNIDNIEIIGGYEPRGMVSSNPASVGPSGMSTLDGLDAVIGFLSFSYTDNITIKNIYFTNSKGGADGYQLRMNRGSNFKIVNCWFDNHQPNESPLSIGYMSGKENLLESVGISNANVYAAVSILKGSVCKVRDFKVGSGYSYTYGPLYLGGKKDPDVYIPDSGNEADWYGEEAPLFILEDSYMTGSGYYAVVVVNADINIKNCTFDQPYSYYAIVLYSTAKCSFTNCVFKGKSTGGNGAVLFRSYSAPSNSYVVTKYATFDWCTFAFDEADANSVILTADRTNSLNIVVNNSVASIGNILLLDPTVVGNTYVEVNNTVLSSNTLNDSSIGTTTLVENNNLVGSPVYIDRANKNVHQTPASPGYQYLPLSDDLLFDLSKKDFKFDINGAPRGDYYGTRYANVSVGAYVDNEGYDFSFPTVTGVLGDAPGVGGFPVGDPALEL